jgi:hypothetical protein
LENSIAIKYDARACENLDRVPARDYLHVGKSESVFGGDQTMASVEVRIIAGLIALARLPEKWPPVLGYPLGDVLSRHVEVLFDFPRLARKSGHILTADIDAKLAKRRLHNILRVRLSGGPFGLD